MISGTSQHQIPVLVCTQIRGAIPRISVTNQLSWSCSPYLVSIASSRWELQRLDEQMQPNNQKLNSLHGLRGMYSCCNYLSYLSKSNFMSPWQKSCHGRWRNWPTVCIWLCAYRGMSLCLSAYTSVCPIEKAPPCMGIHPLFNFPIRNQHSRS